MSGTVDAGQSVSVVDVLLGTRQGKYFLFMGLIYTVIVSACFSLLFFTAGWWVTAAAVFGYAGMTGVFVYIRAPSPELVFPGFLLFAIIPVVTSAGICTVLFFTVM